MIRTTAKTTATIAAAVERAIAEGTLGPGAPVETVRDLAARLKVSPGTVAAAYRLLRLRGVLESDGRRGTRVRARHRLQATTAIAVAAADAIDLASGNPDPALLPPLDRVLARGLASSQTYGRDDRHRGLVAFATAAFDADGISAADLAVTSGALDAIERLLVEHLRPGDRLGLEDPGYPAVHDLALARGFRVAPIAVDGQGLRPEALDAVLRGGARAVVVTPRAQNPTGAALTAERGAELQRVLRQHRDVLTIENDPCAPIAGAPWRSLTGGRSRWAVVRSVSKWLGPDLRVALVAGDAGTIARLRGQQALGPRWVSHVLQGLVLALWADPATGRLLSRAADLYAHRRRAFVAALAAHDVTVDAVSGFNVWVPVRHEAAVVQRMLDAGWSITPGERFRVGAPPGVRVTTSALDASLAPRVAADLAAALRLTAPVLA